MTPREESAAPSRGPLADEPRSMTLLLLLLVSRVAHARACIACVTYDLVLHADPASVRSRMFSVFRVRIRIPMPSSRAREGLVTSRSFFGGLRWIVAHRCSVAHRRFKEICGRALHNIFESDESSACCMGCQFCPAVASREFEGPESSRRFHSRPPHTSLTAIEGGHTSIHEAFDHAKRNCC
ncbi:hypothetical protein IE81DRAFT_69872 [Ceraceosorus guamensis]|uniref:Secreted protein n=1 Tax=Ceraceosorus guamensis TaxID=1522189 RepID=A0A316VNG9_9BASI|nr:hypothetical protein IE81DRAFT_69872 [Ceraceosorus guamensis]PWN38854.1 hypothetical protein IE81DRAFT_69872 [Ceraceosorus guamensis]